MEQEVNFSPILRRIYAFWIPERLRISLGNEKYLYLAKTNTGSLTTAQPIWIVKGAKDCKLGPLPNGMWPVGQKCFVHDGFELTDADALDLWDYYKDMVEFMDLKCEADACGAKPKTMIVSEGSIIGIEEFREKDRQHKKWRGRKSWKALSR